MLRRIAQFFADGEEFFIKGIAQFGAGSIGEAGAAALAAVAVESELADHQHFASHSVQTQIHFAVFILKNPQAKGLFGKIAAFFFSVVGADTQQNQKTLADFAIYFAVNGNGRGIDSC